MEKNIDKLSRPELIDAMRRYMHPTQYLEILKWPTEAIRKLLKVYTGDMFEAA